MNAGNNLANEIVEQRDGTRTGETKTTIQNNLHSICIEKVEENEIIDIVKNCKTKN